MIEDQNDIISCWHSCQNAFQCNWFSFSGLLKSCVQFQDCLDFEDDFGDYITNQVECDIGPSGGDNRVKQMGLM